MTRKLLDDCFLHDKDRLTHAEALALLTSRLGAVAETERAELTESLGRILAETITAPRNIPAHTNAAVSGIGRSLSVTDVTTERVPMEPMSSLQRS